MSRPQHLVHLSEVHPRSFTVLNSWERVRHRQAHWFVECAAEFTGVFFYVFAGVGSTAAYVLGTLVDQQLSSVFQIGIAYSIGIVLALVVCSGTSGGHFNPAVTLSFVLFKGFPPLKAVRYIIAQLLGGYIACLFIYVQYEHLISEVIEALTAAGKLDAIMYTPNGPAGIFALYVLPGSKLGQVFLNEFICDFLIGCVIWAVLDPTNFLVSPVIGPWIIALTYGVCIWGYSPIGLAANAARDLGGRFMVLTIWGKAASGGSYAAIAALTNIPATICGALFYEFVFADSARVLTGANLEFIAGHKAHEERKASGVHGPGSPVPSSYSTEKGHVRNVENA